MHTYLAVFLLAIAAAAASQQHWDGDEALSFDDALALYHPGRYVMKRSAVPDARESDELTAADAGVSSNDDAAALRTRRRSLDILAGIRDRLLRNLKYEFIRVVATLQKWMDSRIANENSIFDLMSFTSEMNSRYFKDIVDIAADAIDEMAQTLIDLGREFAIRLRDFIFNVPPQQKLP